MQGAPILSKMLAVGTMMSLLLGGALFWHVYRAWHQDELQELEDLGRLHASYLAALSAPWAQSGDWEGLRQLLVQCSRNANEIATLEVRDSLGNLLAAAAPREVNARVHEVTVPLGEQVPGSLSVAVSEAIANAEMARLARRMASTIALVTLVGFGAAWWLARLITRPVGELVKSARAVKAGDFRTRVPVRAPDELGELASAFNEMTAALAQHKSVCQQLLREVITATEEERKRVARELHDQLGQGLGSLVAGLAVLNGSHPTPQVARLQELAKQTLAEAHDLSVTLRPKALDELGLLPALQSFCQSLAERSGVAISCAAVGLERDARLPGEIEVALYRIGQEAVANAVRHGQARTVEVLVQRMASRLLVVVEDDGRGFEAHDWRARCLRGAHLGLLGIEERAALLGGTLRVESAPARGTSVFVLIPLRDESHG